MSFLTRLLQNWLFGENPTQEWVVDPNLELVVDLDQRSLCGVALNASAADLAGLGPAEFYEFNDWYNASYPSRGLQLRLRSGLLDEFQLVWDAETATIAQIERFQPFTGKIISHGLPAPIGGQLQVADWLKIFPEPADDTADTTQPREEATPGGERLLEYYSDDHDYGWEVLFNTQGQLAALTLSYYGTHDA